MRSPFRWWWLVLLVLVMVTASISVSDAACDAVLVEMDKKRQDEMEEAGRVCGAVHVTSLAHASTSGLFIPTI